MNKNRKKYYFLRKLKKLETTGLIMKCTGHCPYCEADSVFLINTYDAEGCFACNQWLEDACQDPTCPFCAHRPATPFGALFLLKERAELRIQQSRKDRLRLHYQHQHNTNRIKK
ncbi:MAG: hypothetical protein K2H29_02135 [Oscillospiraceae bacterium]|nr:hypothetical protein [Oscillospiraceae bacterium]